MKRFFLCAIPLLAIGLTYFYFKTPTYSWRQKTTVTIDTPDGPKSGSGVVEINLTVRSRARIGGGKWGWKYWGEGAVVDLGDGKYVFAAFFNKKRSMHPDVVMTEIHRRLDSEVNFGLDISKWVRTLKKQKRVFELIEREYPMLIAFEDINDSTTVTLLKDAQDFRRIFGPRYQLSGITVQATDEKPTDGVIYNTLSWAEDHDDNGKTFDGLNHKYYPTVAPFKRLYSINDFKRIQR